MSFLPYTHKEPKEGISGYKRNFKGGFEPKNYP